MEFEWDAAKERTNSQMHGVSFGEAKELLVCGVDYLEIFDVEHSQDEDRFIAIGPLRRGLIMVVFTERLEGAIRIISARQATTSESRLFWQYMEAKV